MKIQKYLHKLKNITFINYKDVINQVISIIGVVLTIIELIEVAQGPIEGSIERKLIVKNAIIFLVIISINIYSLVNRTKAVKLEKINRNLTEVNDKVRCFRHDFNNIIQAIDGYITLKIWIHYKYILNL